MLWNYFIIISTIVLISGSYKCLKFQVTKNADAAAATADAADALKSEKQALANFAPVIQSSNATFRVSLH